MDVIKYESMGQCVNRAWSVEKHFANLVPAKGAAAPAVVGPAPAGAPAPPAPAPKAAAKKAPGAPGDTFKFTRAWLKSLGAALSIDGDVTVNKPNKHLEHSESDSEGGDSTDFEPKFFKAHHHSDDSSSEDTDSGDDGGPKPPK